MDKCLSTYFPLPLLTERKREKDRESVRESYNYSLKIIISRVILCRLINNIYPLIIVVTPALYFFFIEKRSHNAGANFTSFLLNVIFDK